jgi:FkbM family methyltransferase
MMQLHDFDGGKIWLDTAASEMQALMAESCWEWRKVEYMRRHLKAGMTFVDAGAHSGYFSLQAASLVGETGQVFAFEPEPNNYFEWLLPNIGSNSYQQIMPYQIALSDRRGNYALYLGQHNGKHSLYREVIDQPSVQVRVRPLDHVLEDHPFERPIDMIKIDVEGAEYDVLNGMRKTIRRSPNLHILMDLHPELGFTPSIVEAFLTRDHNFKLYSIRDDFAPIEHIPDSLVELLAVK